MDIFQKIDNKNKCHSIVFNGTILKEMDAIKDCGTWSYNNVFNDKTIQIAQFYCNGMNIDEVCPSEMKNEWEEIKKHHAIFEKAFKEAKINLKEHCFYDIVPRKFILDFFGIKNKITEYVFKTYQKPKNYDFLFEMSKLIDEISKRKLKIDVSSLTNEETRTTNLKNKLKEISHCVRYNLFGSVTGRLTTKKNSFPILTLDKKFRNIIKPTNDFFIELDYNAAELRTFLALNNKEQPQKDIHEWHLELCKEVLTREEMKQKFFAWFYSGNDKLFGVKEIDDGYDKHSILKKMFNGEQIETPYHRIIKTDERKALNMIIQSTTADIFFRRVLEIRKFLKEKILKTFISFLVHDSVVLDVCKNELKHILEIVNIFSNTDYGKFLTRVKIGDSFGNMKDIKI